MCVVSAVHDHFRPLFPDRWPQPTIEPWVPQPSETAPTPNIQPIILPPLVQPLTVEDVKKLIRDYFEALKAAETVDKLTGQPDCEDPEKAKLVERVKELETQIAAMEKSAKAAKKVAKRNRKPKAGR